MFQVLYRTEVASEKHGHNKFSTFKNKPVYHHIRERVVNTSRPGEMQVTIQNLMPDTKYRFRVVAHNSNGQGESSAALKVATQAEGNTHTHKRSFTCVNRTQT